MTDRLDAPTPAEHDLTEPVCTPEGSSGSWVWTYSVGASGNAVVLYRDGYARLTIPITAEEDARLFGSPLTLGELFKDGI